MMPLRNDDAYRVKTLPFSVPEPAPPSLDDPSHLVKAGPVGARYLGIPSIAAPALADSPAAALAGPAMPTAPQAPAQPAKAAQPEWMTPGRQQMMEKAKRAARNYKQAVEQRRLKRKQQQEYSKLYNQFERQIGIAEDLDNMQQHYADLYPPDDPRTLGLVRAQAKHVEAAERLKQQLRQQLKKYGIALGDKDPLPDNPFGATEDDDQRFDSMMQQGYLDALMTPYE